MDLGSALAIKYVINIFRLSDHKYGKYASLADNYTSNDITPCFFISNTSQNQSPLSTPALNFKSASPISKKQGAYPIDKARV